jgi:hypothetical protein
MKAISKFLHLKCYREKRLFEDVKKRRHKISRIRKENFFCNNEFYLASQLEYLNSILTKKKIITEM